MTGSPESPHLQQIMRLIEAHFDRPITVDEIARSVGRRASYLERLFREQYGRGIHACIVERRMREAARLLRQGQKAEAVALSVGYKSRPNFYRQFKKRFGTTPAAFRGSRR
jgi:AraC family transcriptional activator of mar-sox-rob regulon